MKATQSFGKTSVMKIRSPTPHVMIWRPTRRSSGRECEVEIAFPELPVHLAARRRRRSARPWPRVPSARRAATARAAAAPRPARSPPRRRAAGWADSDRAGSAGRPTPPGEPVDGAPRRLAGAQPRPTIATATEPREGTRRSSPDQFGRRRAKRALAEEVGRELQVVADVGEGDLRPVAALDVLHGPLGDGPEALDLLHLLAGEHPGQVTPRGRSTPPSAAARRLVDPGEFPAEVGAPASLGVLSTT